MPNIPFPFPVRRLPYDHRKGADIWPDGARMAVLIYTCPEEWEWNRLEPMGPKGPFVLAGEKVPSLSTCSAVQFGYEVGLRRLRDILKQHDLKITLGTTGNAAERHPEIIAELSGLGHDVAAHGYSEGTPPTCLNRDEQREDIRKTVAAIEKVTGRRPRGWWSPAALCNTDTIELLAEAGLLYHGDLQDDELPYFIDVNGRTLIEIPYNMVGNVNDYDIFLNHRRSIGENLGYMTAAFDAYYEAAGVTPLYMIWGTHPYVSGRADAAYVFSKFLDYVQRRRDVWLPTYTQLAEWWQDRFGGLAKA